MNQQKVTDPNLLAQLGESPRQKVTDPNLLAQLNSNNEEDPGAYLDNLSQGEGFFSKLPRNILIGLTKLGHSTLNLPHDIAASVQNNLGDFANALPGGVTLPKDKRINLADYIPHQQNYDFASMLGQKGDPTLMDELIQGGIQYAPEIAGGGGLLRAATRRLTGVHNLEAVRNAAEQFGENNFAYSPEAIDEARRYLPNTEATRQLIQRSQAGEYPASFAVRSQLGKHERDLASSPLAAERLLAPQVSDLRRNLLSQLQESLRDQGMHVEADLLQQGIRNYGQYMRVRNAITPFIKKFGIPTSAPALAWLGYQKAKKLTKD